MSFYTKEPFKAYKSLEAYNIVVSGFVASIQGCIVAGKHIVTGKARHSQKMNDALISVWVIAEKDRTIRSTHCLRCKAELSESCLHIASILFYIKAWTRMHSKSIGLHPWSEMHMAVTINCKRHSLCQNAGHNFTSTRKLKVVLDDKKKQQLRQKQRGSGNILHRQWKRCKSSSFHGDWKWQLL